MLQFPTDLQISGEACYRFVNQGAHLRDECVSRVALATRAYEVLDLQGLERLLWEAAQPLLHPMGFDTL